MLEHQKIVSDLLNRLQTHNWSEYVQVTNTAPVAPMPGIQPTPDDWWVAHADELSTEDLVDSLRGEINDAV